MKYFAKIRKIGQQVTEKKNEQNTNDHSIKE